MSYVIFTNKKLQSLTEIIKDLLPFECEDVKMCSSIRQGSLDITVVGAKIKNFKKETFFERTFDKRRLHLIKDGDTCFIDNQDLFNAAYKISVDISHFYLDERFKKLNTEELPFKKIEEQQ